MLARAGLAPPQTMPRIKAQDIESKSLDGAVDDPETIPTDEELKTLRRVPASMPWPALLLCIAELAERASYCEWGLAWWHVTS